MNVRIVQLCENETVAFAASEAVKYLRKLDKNSDVALEIRDEFDKNDKRCLWIGLPYDFKGANLPEFNSEKDSVYISEKGGCGIISGSNPRSVLFSVYRMLKSFGCFFDRPGEEGEFIPEINIENTSCNISESAFYDFRGICIEGANTYKNVEDMIDWMAKMEMNVYFIQFMSSIYQFNLWYEHKGSKYLKSDKVSDSDAVGFRRAIVREIKKRGIIYHAIGHGWTNGSIGLLKPEKDKDGNYIISDEVKKYLAEIGGKREIQNASPYSTQLCYGNSEVREKITNYVVKYANEHKEIDIIAFSLSDGECNYCECPLCADLSPSDQFVRLLNELDEKLEQNGLDTKITFSAYVDRVWAPEKLTIKNPKRFKFDVSLITRTYSESYDTSECKDAIPKRIHNVSKAPRDVKMNLKMIKKWTEVTGIPIGFMFEYHYMWDHVGDPGYMQVARILSEDIKKLRDLPSKGFESCQLQRTFLPHGLGMHVMADALWRGEIDFDSYATDYFNNAFGKNGGKVRKYMSEITEIMEPKWLRKDVSMDDKKYAARFEKVYKVLSDFYPIIEENAENADCTMRKNAWENLKFHSGLVKRYADTAIARANGDTDKAKAAFDELSDFIYKNELSVQGVFESYNYLSTVERRVFTDAIW